MSVLNLLEQVETAGQISPQNLHVKLLLHGRSGAGKSTSAATSDKPLILLVESNGLLSIKNSNPDAKVIRATDMATVRAFFMQCAKGDLLKKTGCNTVVIDSLSEIQNMVLNEQIAANGGKSLTISHWQTITQKMRGIFRMLRDLPCDVVGLALSKQIIIEDTGTVHVMPSFSKALREECAGYFSIVGYCFKRQIQDSEGGKPKVEHKILFRGADEILCKTAKTLQDVEEPNLKNIFDRCHAQRSVTTRQKK